MGRYSNLPFPTRIIAYLVEAMTKMMYGRPIPFVGETLKTLGIRGFFAINKSAGNTLKRLFQTYGTRDGNLLVGIAAMWNGCRFCARGHVWVANLYHYRDTGTLFPIDDGEIPAWQRLTDSEILQAIQEKLATPEYERLRGLLIRQFHLKFGDAVGEAPDDGLLRASIAVWDWMNECSIVAEENEVFPPDPIRKDRDLSARYLQARGRPEMAG